jgi:hypothetical protein
MPGACEDAGLEALAVRGVEGRSQPARQGGQADRQAHREVRPPLAPPEQDGRVHQGDRGQPPEVPVDVLPEACHVESRRVDRVERIERVEEDRERGHRRAQLTRRPPRPGAARLAPAFPSAGPRPRHASPRPASLTPVHEPAPSHAPRAPARPAWGPPPPSPPEHGIARERKGFVSSKRPRFHTAWRKKVGTMSNCGTGCLDELQTRLAPAVGS